MDLKISFKSLSYFIRPVNLAHHNTIKQVVAEVCVFGGSYCQIHAGRWTGVSKLSLGVTMCVNECVHSVDLCFTIG